MGKIRNLESKFYIREGGLKDLAVAFGTVTGPLTLYLGFNELFHPDYDYLNTISKIYGIGAMAGVLNHYLGNFFRGLRKFNEVMKYAKEQKKKGQLK